MKARDWRRVQEQKSTALIGYLRIKEALLQTLLDARGGQAIFMEESQDKDDPDHQPPKPLVRWIKPTTGEDRPAYHSRVVTEARQRGKAVLYRRGGGACLGIEGESPEKITMKKWLARGVPWWWGSQELEEMLREQGWRDVVDISEPRSKFQGWIFRALPKNSDDDAFVVQMDEKRAVSIQEWVVRRGAAGGEKVNFRAPGSGAALRLSRR